MDRIIDKHLLDWKNSKDPKPLILKGARQVGKSYSVKTFGAANFKNVIVADFEKFPALERFFGDDLSAQTIVEKLKIFFKTNIVPQESLVFFDEIQRCPRAITALRYFKEDMPDQHVIAAGSLLDFALGEISVPVGRVTYLHMYPLNFVEFLQATGNSMLLEKLAGGSFLQNKDLFFHNLLLEHLKKYTLVGGMPAAVKIFVSSGSLQDVAQTHVDLLEAFRQDFSKYAPRVPFHRILTVMERIPKMIGQQIKYAHIDRNILARDVKQALLLLERAQIVKRVRATSGGGFPLGALATDKTFKMVFLDIGLMHALCGLHNYETIFQGEIELINNGAVAEQFVGQEIMACSPPAMETQLYYWKRDARGSEAEVDYVMPFGSGVAPIEIKSGSGHKLKSLAMFCEAYQPKKAFIVSSQPYRDEGQICWLPFYAISSVLFPQNSPPSPS